MTYDILSAVAVLGWLAAAACFGLLMASISDAGEARRLRREIEFRCVEARGEADATRRKFDDLRADLVKIKGICEGWSE